MSGRRTFRGTTDEIRKLADESDWKSVRSETEDAPVDEDDFDIDWSSATWVSTRKKAVSLRLDADLLDFFKRGGRGYQTRINAVLRAYKDAQEKKAG